MTTGLGGKFRPSMTNGLRKKEKRPSMTTGLRKKEKSTVDDNWSYAEKIDSTVDDNWSKEKGKNRLSLATGLREMRN